MRSYFKDLVLIFYFLKATLSNIIRQGRNQALHFEEHKDLKDEIITCFLKIEIPLEKYKNSAKEVIDLLGWNLYEDYEKDMKSLK